MTKTTVQVSTEKKEYPEMTLAQIRKMVELLNKGISEQEARKLAMTDV